MSQPGTTGAPGTGAPREASNHAAVISYRPEIDGLRALAVLLVIGHHLGADRGVLPSGFLFSNYVSASSLVFRSDKYDAQHPLPAGVLPNATLLATDHLPVMAVFNNPYSPFPILSGTSGGGVVTLRWQSQVNARYRVEASANLLAWTIQASNLVAAATNYTWSNTRNDGARFYRVVRQP